MQNTSGNHINLEAVHYEILLKNKGSFVLANYIMVYVLKLFQPIKLKSFISFKGYVNQRDFE